MSLPLNERLRLSSEAIRLLQVLGDSRLSLIERSKAGRERIEILKKLKGTGEFSPEPDRTETKLETVANAGRDFLTSAGVEIPKDAQEQVANAIKGSEQIKLVFDAQRWSDKRKAEILEKIAYEPRAYDVYRIVKGDTDKTSGNTKRYYIYEAVRDIHKAHYEQLGLKLKDAVFKLGDASPMTYEQALKEAEKCTIDKLARNRLSRQKKGDFTGKTAREDMIGSTAALLRLINYQGDPLTFTVTDSRAHFNNKRKEINIGDALQTKALWHEIAHSIEYDHPEVLEMSKDFLRERLKKSNGIRSLRDIYSNKWGNGRKISYGRAETAIDDGAFDPYVTKFYSKDPNDIDKARATEVITMGIQSLLSDFDLGRMAVADPEHLEFIFGVIRHLQQKQRGINNDQT